MKIQAPIIALWIASAAATFGLGWAIKPNEQPAAEPKGHASVTAPSALGQSSQGTDAKGAGGEAPAAANGFAKIDLEKYIAAGAISADDMAVAMKDMRSENDPLKRRAMFIELLERLDKENAKTAFLALREGRENRGRGQWGGGDEERLLLNAWGRIDGAGAVAELQAMEEARRAEQEAQGGEGGDRRRGPDRGSFDISSVLRGWAMADAAGAIDYLGSVEDDRARGMMGGDIVRGLMVEGVDNALDFVGSLAEDDGARPWYMRTIAEEMLEGGVSSAADWATGLADDGLKEGAMRRVAESFARDDLQAAVAWVESHSGESYASEAVTQVAERWAETDPQAAIDWATSLPEEAQGGAFREALDEWTERDAMAASQYLAQMPASPVRDSAIQGFSTELVREDPESAVTWAATIGDAETREETLVRIARDWYRSDRSGAQAWLPTSGLSQEQQTEIAESRGWGRGPRF